MADVMTFASIGRIFCVKASAFSQSGRLEGFQANLARAWCRADCDLTALASALCAATVPADLAASRIRSPWKVAAHDPQFRSEPRRVLQEARQSDLELTRAVTAYGLEFGLFGDRRAQLLVAYGRLRWTNFVIEAASQRGQPAALFQCLGTRWLLPLVSRRRIERL